jgi:Protein of unknown function (DUF3489)
MTDDIETPEIETLPPEQETEMPTPKKTRKKKAADNARAPRAGSKLEIINRMLHRKNGCTAKEVMTACEWPAVSMPQQAKALGLKLKSEKVGKSKRYWAA